MLDQAPFLKPSEKPPPTMPGHIKLVKGAVDPDPTEFLWPSMDMKKEDQNKVSSILVFLWYHLGLLSYGAVL